MEEYITRAVHEEFAKRQDAENERQNRRIQLLEENVRRINDLTVSVREMAVNMGNMLEEQKKQGERLEKLEKEPSDSYKQIKTVIVTAVISTVVGAVISAIFTLL
ncbi:MAG: hypothetical protein NC094_12095 [Bacteroidales bacterium]|nr:hypothetical protein [Lachnoclostridium sp.]MCM1385263.1 hypothetical protein [Lachnoclostridium sp.]MCM1466151.1 hypothetical protein [Bacteroidales bacterium]